MTSIDQMRQDLADDDGSGGELWDPEAGDMLIAQLVNFEQRFSPKMNTNVRVAVVREYDTRKLWSVWLTRSVLSREFDEQSPQPGDTVGIKYHGRKLSRGGTEFHHYSLRLQRAAGHVAPSERDNDDQADVPADDDDDDGELPF